MPCTIRFNYSKVHYLKPGIVLAIQICTDCVCCSKRQRAPWVLNYQYTTSIGIYSVLRQWGSLGEIVNEYIRTALSFCYEDLHETIYVHQYNTQLVQE